ncbi:MAG: hypothetical protein J7K39_09975 [Bacteroidales bacterium]|nr:hypothetical protein [Bacteroidales bacterium]
MKRAILTLLFLTTVFSHFLNAQDTLIFKGQLSAWLNYNTEKDLSFWTGARYIPQLNYLYSTKNNQLFDVEVSANIFGSLGSNISDSTFTDGEIKPYRAWMRYSGKQFELRAGLQKINFGSAIMFRPLMWFDEMDARDPLNLTDGVWGILGRYYFLNNANIWAWMLYGNEDPRAWEIAQRNKDYPEYGGRIQFPLMESEIGLTFHHQTIDMSSLMGTTLPLTAVAENKMGFDIKIDWHIGLWLEGSWANKNANLGMLTNQEMITLGADYTFGIGNGLYLALEYFTAANDTKAFEFKDPIHFLATSINYPVGLFDNVNAIFYYDSANNTVYNFFNWQKKLNSISINIMAYWNPISSTLPTAGGTNNLYGGKGIQLMLVFNH